MSHGALPVALPGVYEPDGHNYETALMRRRFVVLVSGTLVYGRGDEAEARKAAAAAEADGLAGYGEEAGTPPRFAPVPAPPGGAGRSAALPARHGSLPSAPVAMRHTPSSFKARALARAGCLLKQRAWMACIVSLHSSDCAQIVAFASSDLTAPPGGGARAVDHEPGALLVLERPARDGLPHRPRLTPPGAGRGSRGRAAGSGGVGPGFGSARYTGHHMMRRVRPVLAVLVHVDTSSAARMLYRSKACSVLTHTFKPVTSVPMQAAAVRDSAAR